MYVCLEPAGTVKPQLSEPPLSLHYLKPPLSSIIRMGIPPIAMEADW